MVTAKLDHSRVLVTKFHQNQSRLKGRSASQRHTDRQTDRQTSWLVFTARLRPQFRVPQIDVVSVRCASSGVTTAGDVICQVC